MNSKGIIQIINEVKRVLNPGGEVLLSFPSKDSWEFKESGYPKLDENTVVRKEDGPEYDVPHFYVDLDDIIGLLDNFEIEKVRYTDYCYINGVKQSNKYYYVNAIFKG